MVARCGSFSAAAIELGTTHGSVSRRVAALEAWLGLRLFDRHGRGVRATSDGQRFLSRIDEGLGLIDDAAYRWRSRRGSDVVRLSVGGAFAQLFLLKSLDRVESGLDGQGPPVRIELSIENRNSNLLEGETDVAVRYGRGHWRRLHSELLMEEEHYPVACPELCALIGKVSVADDLWRYPLLHDSDHVGWRNWFADAFGVTLSHRIRDRRFEEYASVLAAARAGLGVALARVPVAAEALEGLERLHERNVASRLNYHLVTRTLEARPAVRQVIDRLHALSARTRQ